MGGSKNPTKVFKKGDKGKQLRGKMGVYWTVSVRTHQKKKVSTAGLRGKSFPIIYAGKENAAQSAKKRAHSTKGKPQGGVFKKGGASRFKQSRRGRRDHKTKNSKEKQAAASWGPLVPRGGGKKIVGKKKMGGPYEHKR